MVSLALTVSSNCICTFRLLYILVFLYTYNVNYGFTSVHSKRFVIFVTYIFACRKKRSMAVSIFDESILLCDKMCLLKNSAH